MNGEYSLSQVFSGIYETFQSSFYLDQITAKLRELKPVTPHESIYIGSREAVVMCGCPYPYKSWPNNIYFYKTVVPHQCLHYTYSQKKTYLTDLFITSCRKNNIRAIQWLVDCFYDQGLIDHRYNQDTPYHAAYTNSHLPVIKWFWEFDSTLRNEHTSKTSISDSILFWACRNNNIQIIQWVWQTVFSHQPPEDVYDVVNDIVSHACCFNRLHVVQWVWSFLGARFFPNPRQKPNWQNNMFTRACLNKTPRFAQWVLGAIKNIDYHAHQEAFVSACALGHLRVAKWLWGLDPKKRPNHRAQNDKAFVRACTRGYFRVAQWLWDLVPSNRPNIHADGDLAFLGACDNNYLRVAQWLWDLVPSDRSDPRMLDDKIFRNACISGYEPMMLWLWKIAPSIKERLVTDKHFWAACYHKGHKNIDQWLRYIRKIRRKKIIIKKI